MPRRRVVFSQSTLDRFSLCVAETNFVGKRSEEGEISFRHHQSNARRHDEENNTPRRLLQFAERFD